jgi:hypothetical protein
METREISHARRTPTNTPLQALVTLNDPVYHEAAQALGQLMLTEVNNKTEQEALQLGFTRVLSRSASQQEVASLEDALQQLSQEAINPAEVWTAIASILLNLDDALTR